MHDVNVQKHETTERRRGDGDDDSDDENRKKRRIRYKSGDNGEQQNGEKVRIYHAVLCSQCDFDCTVPYCTIVLYCTIYIVLYCTGTCTYIYTCTCTHNYYRSHVSIM